MVRAISSTDTPGRAAAQLLKEAVLVFGPVRVAGFAIQQPEFDDDPPPEATLLGQA
jgi:hypothetical protein